MLIVVSSYNSGRSRIIGVDLMERLRLPKDLGLFLRLHCLWKHMMGVFKIDTAILTFNIVVKMCLLFSFRSVNWRRPHTKVLFMFGQKVLLVIDDINNRATPDWSNLGLWSRHRYFAACLLSTFFLGLRSTQKSHFVIINIPTMLTR